MLKIWYWLLKVAAFIALDLHVYYIWSRMGRWLFERKYLSRPLTIYKTVEDLQKTMAPWAWRPDPWWQFGDMISCPQIVEANGFAGRPVGDCDDFSVYAGTILCQLAHGNGMLAGKLVKDFSLLTIPWMGKTGKPSGHNICVFGWRNDDGKWAWAWVSNWYQDKIQWGQLASLQSLADLVAMRGEGRCTRWARVSLDLKKVYETGSGSEKQ